jgi:hypothetical protein
LRRVQHGELNVEAGVKGRIAAPCRGVLLRLTGSTMEAPEPTATMAQAIMVSWVSLRDDHDEHLR